MQKVIKRTGLLLPLCVALLIFLFQTFTAKISSLFANLFTYEKFDPYHLFAWISVHHIARMVIALLVMLALFYILKIDWWLQSGDKKVGLRYVAWFAAVFIIYTTVSYLLIYCFGHLPTYNFPLTSRNVAGTLGFQLFLSGPSEEILFRAFPIAVLSFVLQKPTAIKVFKWRISIEVIIAALFFSIAHISWSVSPFTVSADRFQLIYAFVLGIIYGVTYQKSKSIIYPMIMHSLSNVVMVGAGYFLEIIR